MELMKKMRRLFSWVPGKTTRASGYSFWAGFVFPDQITEGGRFGLEYNYGSKYWTPMTWALAPRPMTGW